VTNPDADGAAAEPHAVHRLPIQLRFADIDMLGHVNNVAYASYVEMARVEFLRSLGERVTSIIVAHLALDYRRPVHEGRALAVDTWVEKIGRTSVTLRQVVWADADRATDVRSVLVFYDYERGAPMEVPAAMRVALEQYKGHGG
jgi:acyl-CoA thioester hydrolase